jgi:hypothetical protein
MKRATTSRKVSTVVPKQNTIVWRYMHLPEFLTLITTRRLMFRQFRSLETNDREEGKIPSDFWESFQRSAQVSTDDALAKIIKQTEENLELLRRYRYVSCWTMAPRENALLWAVYAQHGVAVRTRVMKLRGAPRATQSQSGPIISKGMVYADSWADAEPHGFREWGEVVPNERFLHTKRLFFAGENEVRFYIQPPPIYRRARKGPMADSQDCPPWFPVLFENLKWIDEVVVSSSTPPWAIETIQPLVDAHRIAFRRSGV